MTGCAAAVQPVFFDPPMTTPNATPLDAATPVVDENQLMAERREKLKALRQAQRDGGGVTSPTTSSPKTKPPNSSRPMVL